MDSNAYDEWTSLFNEDVAKVWLNDRPELRNAAMILHVLESEFKRIQTKAEHELTEFRGTFAVIDSNKERISRRTPPKSISILGIGKENADPVELTPTLSPDIFRCKDSSGVFLTPSDIDLNENFREIKSSSDDEVHEEISSPKINRTRTFSRVKRSSDIRPSFSLLDVIKNKRNDTNKGSACENIMDMDGSTVIESSPNNSSIINKQKQGKWIRGQTKNKKGRGEKTCKESNKTLTQMFVNMSASTKTRNDDFQDSDVTYVPPDNSQVNQVLDNVICDETHIEFPENKVEISTNKRKLRDQIVCKTGPVRGKERMKLEGWDCEECKRFYEGLGMDSADAKRLMNKCSRHRSKFKPDDYTPKGFWDMDFTPTPPKRKH